MDEKKYSFIIGDTSEDEIQSAMEVNLDVVRQINEAMQNDNENDSLNLLDMYADANEKEKAIMDAMLVCICGYSMSSIIYLCDKNGYVLE